MCGIAGYLNFKNNYTKSPELHNHIASSMGDTIAHRGPDSGGEWIGEHCALSHRRLAVIDPENGHQPMKRTVGGYDFVICYNGELYNTAELRAELESFGYPFGTSSDTEVLLYAYIHYGKACVERLNGIFAFAVWDAMRRRLFLCRDRFGVKPLFYAEVGDTFVFGSEIKAVLAHPEVECGIDREGLCELFAMSPARTSGCGVYKGIKELKPGHFMIVNRSSVLDAEYWNLESHRHTDSYEETVDRVRYLLFDSVKRQLASDVPLGTLLSGGLDSSIITAVAARETDRLNTYSFDYEGNDIYFKPSDFQPDSDNFWVDRMSSELCTNHKRLVCPNHILTDYLYKAFDAKDLPGMADCDCSLLYYCSVIKKTNTVILSGECSDEIFGGYPWFRDKRAFETCAFPWCYDMSIRSSILKPEVAAELKIEEYSRARYEESVAETPRFEEDSPEEARRREISWLNIKWFMSNLLDRKDRMSMASGLEVRVPFCDHRLVEYVWNIPWSMKFSGGVSKGLLRDAARGLLPEDVRTRRKSPYPKTHNPLYESAVKDMLTDIIEDASSPILEYCDYDALKRAVSSHGDLGAPFFGQLMAFPQFLGYLVQVNMMLGKI